MPRHRRLLTTICSLVLLAGSLGSLLPSPAQAAEDPPPVPSISLDLILPADGSVVDSSVDVAGSVSSGIPTAPATRRLAYLDFSDRGQACGTIGADGCVLSILQNLARRMTDRGNTTVAVVVNDANGERVLDMDPAAGLQPYASAGRIVELLSGVVGDTLFDRPPHQLNQRAFAYLAGLASAGPAGDGTRAWVITAAGPGFRPSNDDVISMQNAGLPGDVYTTNAVGTPCGSLSNGAGDLFAQATGGTCITQDQLTPYVPRDRTLRVGAFVEGAPFASSTTLADSGGFVLSGVPVPTRTADGTAVLRVSAANAQGQTVQVTRTLLLGHAPIVDAGDIVEVAEGSTVVLSGATASDSDGIAFSRWMPGTSFIDPSVIDATFTDTRDEGIRNVTLSVTDNRGRSSTDATNVLVHNVAPDIAPRLLTSSTVDPGMPVAAEVALTDPGLDDSHFVTVDWGDGTVNEVAAPTGSGSGPPVALPEHAYASPGTYTISVSALDNDNGRSISRTLRVVVRDVTAPTFVDPPTGPLVVEATGPGGAVLDYTAPAAADDTDGSPTVECKPPSGTTIPLGSTEVMCTATDDAGNVATTTFVTEVVDTTPPTLSGLPADLRLRTGPGNVATANYTPPTATDLVDADPVVTCTPPVGTALAVGQHRVTCTATDDAGNLTVGTFVITVVPGYSFVGFDRPVDSGVWNVVKGGQAVPLKWQVLDADGRPVTDVAVIASVASYPLSCTSGLSEDAVETTVASSSPLRFDAATGRFHLNWKTPSAVGCYRLVIRLTDGTTGTADFKIR